MSTDLRLASSFAAEHPRVVAALLTGAERETLGTFLLQLPVPVAAALIAHSSPLTAAAALEALPEKRASAILAELDTALSAALLGRVGDETRRKLIAELPRRTAEYVERLLAYSADEAGGHMDPRAPAVLESSSVAQAVEAVRAEPKSALHYVYVIDDQQILVGVVNLRELLSADPTTPIAALLTEDPERLHARDPVDRVLVHPAWHRVHALPVVDERDRFVGALRYASFRALEGEAGRAHTGADPSRTSAALAELFLLGAGAALRTAEGALLGSYRGRQP